MYKVCFVLVFKLALINADLPTLYEYYTNGGITSGLSDNQPYFMLNGKNITIYSGSFHYYRVPRAYWRDRLRKMRAAGLNAVATCIPWNLHEPQAGVYDFGNGGSDMEDFLHLEEFFKTAKEEDLFAFVRTGPFTEGEFENGGLPSWINRNVTSIRNSHDKYFLDFAKKYLNVLLIVLSSVQFQKGGSIIGFQIENEYGNLQRSDLPYLEAIRDVFLENGITELLFTSDRPRMNGVGAIPGVLQMANFGSDAVNQLNHLNILQTNKPTMTMEYWTGWFDHWMDDQHNTKDLASFRKVLVDILDYPSSVNMYMFVGSTSFGFFSGGSISVNGSTFQPYTNSYDYDAPLTEYGSYTEKYFTVKELIESHNPIKTYIPAVPELQPLVAYEQLEPVGQLLLEEAINTLEYQHISENVIPMEMLPINNNSGQSYGYIVYRITNINIPSLSKLKIGKYVGDTVLVMINGVLISKSPETKADVNGFGFWKLFNSTLDLPEQELNNVTLDLVVENFGRNSRGNIFFKGLTGDVFLNEEKIHNWIIMPLEFRKSWSNLLNGWHQITTKSNTPALYKFSLNIEGEVKDTFIDFREWTKGLVLVNGFVLSRYFLFGPQQTVYLPAPFLKLGNNTIIVFEHYSAPDLLKFSDKPIFDVKY